jgi:hypothetical protein
MIGEYSVNDLRMTVLKSFEDPERPKKPTLMIDLSKSQSISKRSSTIINEVAAFIASFGKRFNNRLALVAPDDLTYGLMRMSSAPADSFGINVEIFRTYEEARKWLLPAPPRP